MMVWIITRRNWILGGSLALCLAGVVARRLLDKAAERLALPIEMGRLAP